MGILLTASRRLLEVVRMGLVESGECGGREQLGAYGHV